MSYLLRNKVVLITGASIGIGEALALALAPHGPRLLLTYRTHPDEIEMVANQCRSLGAVEVKTLQLDVGNDSSIREVIAAIATEFEQIDVLINNAGIVLWKRFADQTWDEIESQLRINLEGLIKVTKTALPLVRDVIVNLSSAGGLRGYEDITVYCATKFGVRGFSQALAQELPDVRVYSLNPGVIATQMNDFEGHPPSMVADAVLDVLLERAIIESGGDINVF